MLAKNSLLLSLITLTIIACSNQPQPSTPVSSASKSSTVPITTPIPAQQSNKLIDVADFAKDAEFTSIKISPDGKYFAALTPIEGIDALAIIRRSDMKITANYRFNEFGVNDNFQWVNNERVIFESVIKIGYLDQPFRTCNLYGINADDTRKTILFGPEARDSSREGSRIKSRKADRACANIENVLMKDDKHIVISAYPFSSSGSTPVFYRMNVYSGKKVKLAAGPVGEINRIFLVGDSMGEPRFAYAQANDLTGRFYTKQADDKNWQLVKEFSESRLTPLALTADDSKLYLLSDEGIDKLALYLYDFSTNSKELVFSDDSVSITGTMRDNFTNQLTAVTYSPSKPKIHFLDDQLAEVYDALQPAFPGQTIRITSRTRNSNEFVILVSSDVNSGEFYIYNKEKKNVNFLLARHEWLDPNQLASMQPISLKARDGMPLNGYLTLPKDKAKTNLPLIVYPHGGPRARDNWGYDPDVQMLASRGYAVLQINFRGSIGYGKKFLTAGYRQWGGAMQDDVTDATRWAIDQGIADADRICIYGNSYGAYAAMMGVIKEQGLYQCAVGYIGVYDLPLLFSRRGDNARQEVGVNSLKLTVGEDKELLKKNSPVYNADKINVPVFLIHGGEDRRAPIIHAKRLRKALEKNNVPYEWLVKDQEAHGFANPDNREELFQRLEQFFAKHIGS